MSLVRAFATREQRPLTLGVSNLSDHLRLRLLTQSVSKAKSAPSFIDKTTNTSELIVGLQRGDIDLAVVDLPIKARGLRLAPLFLEPLTAIVPEGLTSSIKQTIRLADLVRVPMVLLSSLIDPARAVIDHTLSSVGTCGFRIHDAGTVTELLDQVAIHRRAGCLLPCLEYIK